MAQNDFDRVSPQSTNHKIFKMDQQNVFNGWINSTSGIQLKPGLIIYFNYWMKKVYTGYKFSQKAGSLLKLVIKNHGPYDIGHTGFGFT